MTTCDEDVRERHVLRHVWASEGSMRTTEPRTERRQSAERLLTVLIVLYRNGTANSPTA